jgi:phosphoglycerol transferase MdoB-like AlkP superfamily enzyme
MTTRRAGQPARRLLYLHNNTQKRTLAADFNHEKVRFQMVDIFVVWAFFAALCVLLLRIGSQWRMRPKIALALGALLGAFWAKIFFWAWAVLHA